MSMQRTELLAHLGPTGSSPALRQIAQMANNDGTETDFSAPVQSVHEVLSVWSIRLWNATLRGRRFVGLADFVRALMRLEPDGKVRQVSVQNGPKVGLVFFEIQSERPIGAVISVRMAMDEKRSNQNFATANGMHFPIVTSRAAGKSK